MTAALKIVEDPFAGDDAKWAASRARDPHAVGAFYVCVATTGVFCLPTCAGRPNRENVAFVATRAEAERAGYRACKRCRPERYVAGPIAARLSEIGWTRVSAELGAAGFSKLGTILAAEECASLVEGYSDDQRYRSTVTMGRHGLGAGEYRYFADPLPLVVGELRERLYARLAPTASEWARALGGDGVYPARHTDYRKRCASLGQSRPTPLILKYGPGDYNRLHQDLYGEEVFPIQCAILLSEPGKDFEGGEFVLTEQRPRMQSRASVVRLQLGEALAFAVNDRPVEGARGVFRARMRHGVSTVSAGSRFCLGVIFHDAP